ncbi:hypothetical protein ID866_7147 [Astraeus odoratus]|nr:hypothetical protein ID866_7147 [Astraeus odoratus]
MFIRAYALLVPVLATAALAAAVPEAIVARNGKCSNGSEYCCKTTYTADQTGVDAIYALLGVTVNPVVGPLLATGCSPITVIGVGSSSSCTQQDVCCTGTQFVSAVYKFVNGLVNVGCIAVSV